VTGEIVLIDNINNSSSSSGSRINRTLDGSATVEYGLEKECCERVLDKHIVVKGHTQYLLAMGKTRACATRGTKNDEADDKDNALVLCYEICLNREIRSPEDEARADGRMSR